MTWDVSSFGQMVLCSFGALVFLWFFAVWSRAWRRAAGWRDKGDGVT